MQERDKRVVDKDGWFCLASTYERRPLFIQTRRRLHRYTLRFAQNLQGRTHLRNVLVPAGGRTGHYYTGEVQASLYQCKVKSSTYEPFDGRKLCIGVYVSQRRRRR